jgi:carboxypeptidase C (cathepsin A)
LGEVEINGEKRTYPRGYTIG